jgi:hypothetical protein
MTVSGLPAEVEPMAAELERRIRRLVGIVSWDTRYWPLQHEVMDTYRQFIAWQEQAIIRKMGWRAEGLQSGPHHGLLQS